MARDKKRFLLSLLAHAGVSTVIVVTVYFVDILLFASSEMLSPTDALFVEGIMALIFGSMLLLGRGGINLSSLRAAILSATVEATSGTEGVGPAEQMRIDAWRSKGFKRAGLVLVMTGLIMLAAYFLTL